MSIQGDGTWDSITWPYPQIRVTDYYVIGLSLVGTDLYVYELLNNNDVWTASEVASLGAVANIDYVDVQGWGPFYIVTASKVVNNIMTTTAIARYPDGTVTTLPNAAIPSFSAICDFNGQALISGVQSSTAPWDSMKYSDVAWSGIGSFDFRPSEQGNQTAGYIHVPQVGEGTGLTRRIMQLDKVVMVYTESGLHALFPHKIGRSGFGRKDINDVGIKNPNHMTGSINTHLYLNTENELVLIGKDANPQLLGYKEFMAGLTNSEIRMSYVPSKKRFYISDSTTGYVLTENGLYSCHQCVTSSWDYRGRVLCGFYNDTQDRVPRLTTDTLDFGVRGFKTLQSVEADLRYLEGTDEAYISCQFRSDYQSDKDAFSQSAWVRLNPMGIASPIVTANEFRVRLKGVDYEDSKFNLSRLDIKYQFADKRNIRGVKNASKTSSRPSFR